MRFQKWQNSSLEPGQSYYDALAENREEFATEAHQLHENAARAFREGASHLRHEFPCRRSDGEIRWIDENAYIQPVAPGRWRVIGVSTDITERKKAEEERLKFESQLLYAQKMESIGILAGGIAHDFNNILASILGNAELALVDVDQTSPAHANLQEIESSAQRAADLTRQMLAYSGKGKFMVRPVLISDEIPELVKLLTASISKKCALRCDVPAALPKIDADASQIQQVIFNLVVNAAEAIGDREGTITVRAYAMECGRDYLSGCYIDDQLPEGQYLAIDVTDTGGGIAPEVYSRLFDPFFSTKFVGRGLGLAAVMGIVRSHGGAIRVSSEPGVRATFTVLFPACDSGGLAAAIAALSRQTAGRGNGTILVVDDEAAVRNLTVKALERAGYRVITADDGRQGVETFRDNADKISLVLLDMTMPYKDGGEVFQEIRRLRCDVKVILSSGFSEEDTMERFGQHGLAGFIQKPYRVTDLLGIISSALNSPGQ